MVQSHKAKETNYLINIKNLVYFMVVGKKDCRLYTYNPQKPGLTCKICILNELNLSLDTGPLVVQQDVNGLLVTTYLV